MHTRRAFTLVELMVVVAIIVALLAMLLPSLGKAIGVAEDAKCRTQVRSVAQGMLQFCADHKATMPGCYTGSYVGPEPWQKSWLGNEVWTGVAFQGTLLPYVGGKSTVVDAKLYRCPSLAPGTPGSGVGSNGMFDYSMLQVFTGAKLTALPTSCQIAIPDTTETYRGSTPIVTEEDPTYYLNANMEPGFSNLDRVGSWHVNRGGNMAAIDGSTIHINWKTRGANALEMTANAPSGAVVNFNGVGNYYGSWNGR